ncbi:Uncharacterized protein dnm_044430 [Desulfonema magnum]|uniref:Uncharacterized protein n=1 Tax=Desulfonema magnum TaxID=45655 RepID=A0A975BNE4_9BACT|nr:Uncharacterized protein dnm_044430 [Desulfonema magnum]
MISRLVPAELGTQIIGKGYVVPKSGLTPERASAELFCRSGSKKNISRRLSEFKIVLYLIC